MATLCALVTPVLLGLLAQYFAVWIGRWKPRSCSEYDDVKHRVHNICGANTNVLTLIMINDVRLDMDTFQANVKCVPKVNTPSSGILMRGIYFRLETPPGVRPIRPISRKDATFFECMRLHVSEADAPTG